MSPAFDADIERGHVLLEINRQPIRSIEDYRRMTANARSGDVLALYLFKPEITRRELHTVKIDVSLASSSSTTKPPSATR